MYLPKVPRHSRGKIDFYYKGKQKGSFAIFPKRFASDCATFKIEREREMEREEIVGATFSSTIFTTAELQFSPLRPMKCLASIEAKICRKGRSYILRYGQRIIPKEVVENWDWDRRTLCRKRRENFHPQENVAQNHGSAISR